MKEFIENVKEGYLKVQAVCCFTSLMTIVSFVFVTLTAAIFPHPSDILADIFSVAFIIMYGIGVISALLACPGKWICILIAMVTVGFSIGVIFLLVGAVFGVAIAGILFIGLFGLIPSVITIPHYFKEVRYKF